MKKTLILLCAIIFLLLLIGLAIALFFWGKRRVLNPSDAKTQNEKDESLSTEPEKKKKTALFTGNNKWKVFPYYKGEPLAPDGYELELFDFIYGTEKGYTKATVTKTDKKNLAVGFNPSGTGSFCFGNIMFVQDDGLVFEVRDHTHKENNNLYEISYLYKNLETPKEASYIIIKDGTIVIISKKDNSDEMWQLVFEENVAQYRTHKETQEEPVRVLSDEDEFSFAEFFGKVAEDLYNRIIDSNIYKKFCGKKGSGENED